MAAHTSSAPGSAASSARSAPVPGKTSATANVPVVYDTSGHYQVDQQWFAFTEPPRATTTGQQPGPSPSQPPGPRRLLTQVLYPLAAGPAPGPAPGPRPLIVFAPGFMQCGHPYYQLLASWASAGYVVAVVNFPYSDCVIGAAATESDMVNQPADVSYAITALLARSGARSGPLTGLLNPAQIAITGQSDGGDTVAAIAANTCCSDPRVRAVAVLSGAEWPPMPGGYFRTAPVPILFTQGSDDTVNPPILSVNMYQQDPSTERYYLDLLGADHTTPYWGANPAERVVAQVTLDFFGRYLLGRAAAVQAMLTDGTVPGVAAMAAGQQPAP